MPPIILFPIICVSIALKIFTCTSLRVLFKIFTYTCHILHVQVKKVFVDGLPASWDEDRVRDLLKKYGKIEKIELARNMPSAKRKDFGFITFDTHDSAVTCAKNINNTELGEGESKVSIVNWIFLIFFLDMLLDIFNGLFRSRLKSEPDYRGQFQEAKASVILAVIFILHMGPHMALRLLGDVQFRHVVFLSVKQEVLEVTCHLSIVV